MSFSVTTVKLDMMRHVLNTLYAQANAYATHLADLDLDDKEKDLLVRQHRDQTVKQALGAIEHTFGGWEIVRDPAEAACP